MDVNSLIALSAAQGTGKTELARGLATRLGGVHAAVSAYLSAALAAAGLEPTPQLLREHGEILANDPANLVHCVLNHYRWSGDAPLVFDSIRHEQVLDALRDAVQPTPVLHVALVVPEHERQVRLLVRNREPLDPSLATHSTEVQVPTLVQTADLILDATSPVDQMVSEVVEAMPRR